MTKYMIVTNNPSVQEKYDVIQEVEGDFRDVLVAVRDLIHLGWRPLTHPLPASIRMMYSPVRSVVVTEESHDQSYEIIDQAMDLYDRTMGQRKPDYVNLEDYRLLDLELLTASLEDLS
ncbi:GrdX family protein [Facklamia hominis]|uniref:GrdX family protein n=1 Tax=Facklamia hominis TaxID=178214 RepID=A0AAJ1Q672_9LACT|nr:GrdX family protein [Facklamia hominis]MDK7187286.1 GrdX family protein [Facklamia hominis]